MRNHRINRLGSRPIRLDTSATHVLAVMLLVAGFVLSVWIDLAPRFHLEDSVDFILDGESGISRVRSWTYGLFVNWLVRTSGELVSVPLCQAVVLWTAMTTFAIAVTRTIRPGFPIAPLLVIAACCEPLAYYWSHAIMADSFAVAAFAVFCAALLLPLRPRLRTLMVFATAFALISFRLVYFPPLLEAAGITFAWTLWRMRRTRDGKDAVSGIALHKASRAWLGILGAIVVADFSYACANTLVTQSRTLSSDIADMEFLVGALSPLMGDELDLTPLTPGERAVLIPLAYKNRVANTFGDHGLVPLITSHFSSMEKARPALQRLVLECIRRHPAGIAGLVVRQWLDYLDPVLVIRSQRAGVLTGAVPTRLNDPQVVLPDKVVAALRKWNVMPPATRDLPSQPSPALSYVEAFGGTWSLVLAYFATLSVFFVLIFPKTARTDFLIFVNSFAFLYILTIMLGANQMVTRYLLPLDVPLLYTVVALITGRSGTALGSIPLSVAG